MFFFELVSNHGFTVVEIKNIEGVEAWYEDGERYTDAEKLNEIDETIRVFKENLRRSGRVHGHGDASDTDGAILGREPRGNRERNNGKNGRDYERGTPPRSLFQFSD